MVIGNHLQAERSNLLCVFVPVQKFQSVCTHWDDLFWQLILPTKHVPSKYVTKHINSGQIRSCNLGCFQGSCTKQRGTKTGANCLVCEINKRSPSVDILWFRVWANWKKYPFTPCCRKGKLSCLDVCQKAIFGWVGEMTQFDFSVGETGVGEMGLIHP